VGTEAGVRVFYNTANIFSQNGRDGQPIKIIQDGNVELLLDKDHTIGHSYFLNLDNINDYILILKRNGEDTLSDVVKHPEPRPLLILLRDKNNKLQFAKSNDNTVYCFDCGGAMGDPYTGLAIKDGYFSVEHYGGSAWRWSRIITYKFSTKDNEWYLHKDGYESFNANDPEEVEKNIKTTKDFGVVKFENFDIYKGE